MQIAAFVALFMLSGAPQDAPTPDDAIDVITVDDAGRPVGGIGVELDITFDDSVVAYDPKQKKMLRPVPDPIVAITDATGRARFSSEFIELWRSSAPKEPDQSSFPRTQAWVRVLVPFGGVFLTDVSASSHSPVDVSVGTIETVELRLLDTRKRPFAHDADVVFRFDDGKRGQSLFSASVFAHRGDRLIVPIPTAKLATAYVRAGRGTDRTARVPLHASGADHDVLDLEFGPGPQITGSLRTPAGEPVASLPILVAPVHPRLPSTCMRFGEQKSRTGWKWTSHGDRGFVSWEGSWDGSIDANRIEESKTADDGAFSVTIPLDSTNAARTTLVQDWMAASVLRIEVHHELGQCWLADVPFDAALESGTVDVGTITLTTDARMVCGRVVDDRGEPILGASMQVEESGDRRIARDGMTEVRRNTDAVGRFHFRLSEPRLVTARKDGYLSPPAVRIDPGTVEHTIQLDRCATLRLECNPSPTLAPERFELRWRRADLDDSAQLHQWNSTIDRVASGALTVSLFLKGVATPLVERPLTLEPGATQTIDLDLRDCGLVTLRVTADGGGLPLDARVLLNGTNRSLELDGGGGARFAIATPTVALTIRAPGFADVSGVYGHGEHAVVLMPSK